MCNATNNTNDTNTTTNNNDRNTNNNNSNTIYYCLIRPRLFLRRITCPMRLTELAALFAFVNNQQHVNVVLIKHNIVVLLEIDKNDIFEDC